MNKIAILLGSDSDLEIMKDGLETLEHLKIPFEIKIYSAHRTINKVIDFIKNAKKNKFEVIIAGAGMSAHLPGVCAALTTLPVIGIPFKSKNLEGLDALLSIVQMPPGIPVATVGINASKNACLLAASILSIKYKEIEKKLKVLREKNKENILIKNEKLKKYGWEKYLNEKNNKS